MNSRIMAMHFSEARSTTWKPFSRSQSMPPETVIRIGSASLSSDIIEGISSASVASRTGDTSTAVCPHDHKHVLATYHQAGADRTLNERAKILAIENPDQASEEDRIGLAVVA